MRWDDPNLPAETCLFLDEIVLSMVEEFAVSEVDAVTQINAAVKSRLIAGGDMIYHEAPEFWACAVYYGRRDFWRDHDHGFGKSAIRREQS